MGEQAPSPSERLAWNVVVTSREGGQRRLRRALSPITRLQRTGFRNVLVGCVENSEAFFVAVAELCERRPRLENWLGRALPIERTFAVDPANFRTQLTVEAAPFLERLVGRSFHVRVARRGHKGIIDTHACERALGEFLYDALQARGHEAVVTFADPDVVLGVEVLGDACGLAVVTRTLRRRFPFVKID